MGRKTLDISLIAANYNNGRFLDEFFRSVIHASALPKELIVVDDGSTDQSMEIIRSYLSHGFIRLIQFEENRGFAHALNTAVGASTGSYIARIDPDDMIFPGRLESQYEFLQDHPGIDVVGGNVTYFNSASGRDVFTSNFPGTHRLILRAYRGGDHGVQHPAVMAKGEILKRYAYKQEACPAEDYDLFARMIRDGCRFANLREPLNRMRIHPGSVSGRIDRSTIDKTFALRDEIFGLRSSRFRRGRYFLCIRHYRKFLLSGNLLLKACHLIIASCCYPEKVIQRIAPAMKPLETKQPRP